MGAMASASASALALSLTLTLALASVVVMALAWRRGCIRRAVPRFSCRPDRSGASVYLFVQIFADASTRQGVGWRTPFSYSPDKGEGVASVVYSVCRRGDAQCHPPQPHGVDACNEGGSQQPLCLRQVILEDSGAAGIGHSPNACIKQIYRFQ